MNFYCRCITIFLMFLSLPAISQSSGKESALKLKTIVIDPGHGGKDAGCVSKDKRTYEKNLTLSISKLLGQKISEAYPDVKVIYTRSTDKYLTLNERADIANRNHADLFVSIHINSVASTSPNGFSTHILGQSRDKNRDLFSYNMDVCRRENSVILLEEDYSTKYQGFDPTDPESFIFFNLMQNAFYEQSLLFAAEVNKQLALGPIKHSRGISQDPFYVLWKTTMPSVLIEAGFISNYSDLKILNSASGKDQIAQRLFVAFKEFKKKYDGSIDYEVGAAPPKEQTQQAPPEKSESGVAYGVQVFASGRIIGTDDKFFKGLEVQRYKSGDLYKYITGISETEQAARAIHKTVKKKFPDSFVIKIENNIVSRVK